MPKRIILLMLITMALCWKADGLCAQDVCEMGFYGGTNKAKLEERFFDYDNRWGGQVGFDAKVGAKWVQVEMSLGYLNAGTKYTLNSRVGLNENSMHQEQTFKYKSSAHYVDIPVSLALGWWGMEDSGFGLTVSGGAYMSVGLAGKIKVKGDFKSHDESGFLYETFSKDYSTKLFGDEPFQYKRFDAGWTVGARLALGEVFRVAVSYRQGLVNLSNVDGYKATNRMLMIGVIFAIPGDDY